MTKVIQLHNNISQLAIFSAEEKTITFEKAFAESELGKLYKLIPWEELVQIVRKSIKPKRKGPSSLFDLRGKIALMFLKHYCNCSDSQLIERLNSDWKIQLFCGVWILPEAPISNIKIVSAIRTELGEALSEKAFDEIQQIFIKAWKPNLENTHIGNMDATVYESFIRYPTDVKLLWECCDWLYKKLNWWKDHIKIEIPRIKYKDQKAKYLIYQKTKKKTHAKANPRKRSLLMMLGKMLNIHQCILDHQGITLHDLDKRYQGKIRTILKINLEQSHLFENKDIKIKHRTVSLAKPYIETIVRGKENKPYEFGAKVHMVQIDGINLIEHMSFEAYNECTRLKSSVHLIRKSTGKCTHIGADAIYATNKNRSYCTGQNIHTSFVRKGKAGKLEDQRSQMQKLLSKDRATRMEGSFGTEKEHYNLKKIKARTAGNEKLWIFFGVHTANLCRMIQKIENKIASSKAA